LRPRRRRSLLRTARLCTVLGGPQVSEVRDVKDLAERLADLYEAQGRGEEAKELRRQARGGLLPAIQSTGKVEPGGSILRQKATIPFGKGGLPFDQTAERMRDLENVALERCFGLWGNRKSLRYQHRPRSPRLCKTNRS